ncbi:hypothetical protein HNQ91_001852 [Filimonas zeae]|uniref:HEAT repeat domain-containing protein n=1 Tax=Filimonas zeae TaxID=1737353 RepID=A0A917MVN0_9BACT|nr:HEAT repeat domain-containing protein [Filimonas zeae]MDR6338801.1 hypothetical protein [Filimonas zeae]GGH66539.1 hypothetical protein GCM10011379_20830 [Filimonas zeae]
MNYLTGLPAQVQIALLILLIAFTGILFSMVILLLYRLVMYRRNKRERICINTIQALLAKEVVLNEQLHRGTPVKAVVLDIAAFKAIPLHKKWCRQLLVAQLIEYRHLLSGKTAELLRKLYVELGLYRQARSFINSARPGHIAAGLHELCEMAMPADKDRLLMLAQHTDRNVMEMARCACVRLLREPLVFLKEVQKPLLPWEKLELLRLLSLRNDVCLPEFSGFMNEAYHHSVISLSMRAAAWFQQFEAIPALMKMLDNPEQELRAEAVNALGRLGAEVAEEILVQRYTAETMMVKIEVVKALGRIGSGRCLVFLEQELTDGEVFELRKKSARSIIQHKALAKNNIQRLTEHTIGLPHLMIVHSANPLIRN